MTLKQVIENWIAQNQIDGPLGWAIYEAETGIKRDDVLYYYTAAAVDGSVSAADLPSLLRME